MEACLNIQAVGSRVAEVKKTTVPERENVHVHVPSSPRRFINITVFTLMNCVSDAQIFGGFSATQIFPILNYLDGGNNVYPLERR